MKSADIDSATSIQRKHWLLTRYWSVAWLILLLSTPLYLFAGQFPDVWGVAAYAVITLLGWFIGQRNPSLGISFHLLALFPYWTWYTQLAEALPIRLDIGVTEHFALLIFPSLILVALWGYWGGISVGLLGIISLLLRWSEIDSRLMGLFILSMSILLGFVFRNLVVQLTQAHDRMQRLAFHDSLTKLGNRRMLKRESILRLSDPDSTLGALLFIDLSRFKKINDAFGHSAGDEVLRRTASRLSKTLPSHQLATRVGGGEFAVLLTKLQKEEEALQIAQDIIAALSEPFIIRGRSLHLGITIGIALWPIHARSLECLLQYADIAMYKAKTQHASLEVYQPQFRENSLDSYETEVDLWKALQNNELVLYCQPILDLKDVVIVGAEALIRWQHPQHGLISPARFIGLAEESGQIVEIDRWVFQHAANFVKEWCEQGWPGWLSVNLSAHSLCDDSFIKTLERILLEMEIPANRFVLELTESAAMIDPEVSVMNLQKLMAMGFSIALDDFGMGYSSLAYLKRLPIDRVKIDQSFTRGIGKHLFDEQLIELIINLASNWKLGIVAEGVANQNQIDWLLAHGCRFGQGFGICKPIPAGRFMEIFWQVSKEPTLRVVQGIEDF